MAADRELTFRILTTAETAALDQTARALADVARAGTDLAPDLDTAARGMDGLDTAARDAATTLDKVDTAVTNVDLDQLGTEAKQAAAKVDDAFDAMGRSASTGARKVDTSSDSTKKSLRGVASEAADTAKESAQSFSSTGDIGDALQEMAAVAPATLGPIGLAFGTVAAVGVGLFRSKTEALKERVGELVDSMIEAGGRLDEETVKSELQTMAREGTLRTLKDAADAAGQSYRDLARARAGDEDASKRAMVAAREVEKGLLDQADAGTVLTAEQEIRLRAVRDYIQELKVGADAIGLAKEATDDYTTATMTNAETVKTATATARGAWDDLRGSMVDPITGKVRVQAPTPGQLAGIRRDIADGIGPIIVDVVARPKNTALFYPGSRSVP